MEELQNPGADNISSAEQNPPKNPALAFFEKRKIFVILALALVVLIVIACVVFIPQSPERVAEEYCEAALFRDISKKDAYSAYSTYAEDDLDEEFFEKKSDLYDEDITNLQELSNVCRTREEEELYDHYGEYEVTIESTRTRDMSMRKLEEEYNYSLKTMEAEGIFDRDDIEDIKVITVKIRIQGEDDNDRDTYDVIVVKLGSSWKVLSLS